MLEWRWKEAAFQTEEIASENWGVRGEETKYVPGAHRERESTVSPLLIFRFGDLEVYLWLQNQREKFTFPD